MIDGLAAAGYQDGDAIRLRRFNAEGDAATSNTIARELVSGEYDLIVTLSTPSLQAVAGANRDAKIPHVFGMVSDPVAAGVGIAPDDPMKHPPYMVGLGTMQPVAEAFRMARKLAPKLRGSASPGTRRRPIPRRAPRLPGRLAENWGSSCSKRMWTTQQGFVNRSPRSSAAAPRPSGLAAT